MTYNETKAKAAELFEEQAHNIMACLQDANGIESGDISVEQCVEFDNIKEQFSRLAADVIQSERSIYDGLSVFEKCIVDAYLDATDGMAEVKKNGKIVINFLGDNPIEFENVNEALDDILYTFGEWVKEGKKERA